MRNLHIEECRSEIDTYAVSTLQDQPRFREFLYLNQHFKSDLIIIDVEKQLPDGRFVKYYRVVMSSSSEFVALFQEDQFVIYTQTTVAVGARIRQCSSRLDNQVELLIHQYQQNQSIFQQRIKL